MNLNFILMGWFLIQALFSLTLTFFLLFAVSKTDSRSLKLFGKALVGIFIVTALISFIIVLLVLVLDKTSLPMPLSFPR